MCMLPETGFPNVMLLDDISQGSGTQFSSPIGLFKDKDKANDFLMVD